MRSESKQPPTDLVLEQALSHPKRLETLGYLRQKKGLGADEAELAAALYLSIPGVKYHLLVLQDAGLIAHLEDREPETFGRYIAAA
ncbi:MAG: hypothetical protein ACJ75S_11625 [Solirubrobacterales bacterium]